MKKQYLAYALTGMMLFSTSPHQIYAAQNTEDRIHMLDVKGDAILIESNGKFVLVDGGEDSDNPRNFPELTVAHRYEEDVVNYLKKVAGDKNGKVTLEFIIGTHAHSDHLGGLDTVVNHPDITVKKIYLKEYKEEMIVDYEREEWDNKEVYEQLLTAAKNNNVPVIHNLPTTSFKLEDFTLQLYNTELPNPSKKVGENENSLAIKVSKGKNSMLLAGDMNNLDGDEDRLAKKIGKVDLLKLGHHGLNGSSSESFLNALNPKIAFSNTGGHETVRDPLSELKAVHYAVEHNDGIIVEFKDNNYELYRANDYAYKNKINNPHRHFNTWSLEKGYWEYLNSNGIPLTGWQKLHWKGDHSWYYFNTSGVMQTGWQKLNWNGKTSWYYFNSSGAMQTGWQKLNWNGKTSWYYFNSSGAMQTGWQKLNWNGKTSWYYFNMSGAMQTGWLKDGGKTYYLEQDGSMITGSKWINGKLYHFDNTGALK